jgi:hypothetical protein
MPWRHDVRATSACRMLIAPSSLLAHHLPFVQSSRLTDGRTEMAHKSKSAEERSIREEPAPVAGGPADREALRQEIQLRAYYRYCERGCAPGADVNDWLAAEREVLAVHAEPAASEGVRR